MKTFRGVQSLAARLIAHLKYTPILGLAALIGFVRIGIYARLLSVDEFGLLSKLLLISGFFCVAGSCGFQILAQRDLPAMFARQRYRRGLVILGKACMITSVVALLLCVTPMFGYVPLNVAALALLIGVIHGWAQQSFMLVVLDSRSRLAMVPYSLQILQRTVLCCVVASGVAMLGGGALGILLAELAVTVVLSVTLLKKMLQGIGFSWAVFARLCKTGFTKKEWRVAAILLLGTTLSFLSTSVDRWLAADVLSAKQFGLYSFAWIPLVAALSMQALLNAGLFPLIAQRRVAGSDQNALRVTALVSVGLLLAALVLVLLANKLIAWAIPIWYGQYQDALPLFLPLLAAAAFRVSDFWSSFLIITHRHVSLLVTQLILIMLAFVYCRFALDGTAWMQNPYNFTLLALFLAAGNYFANASLAFVVGRRAAS